MKKKYKDMNDFEKIDSNIKLATRIVKILIVFLVIAIILQVVVVLM